MNVFSKKDVTHHRQEHQFSTEKSFDYDQITEHIFLGTNMCCQIGYSEELLEKGVVADISLEEERLDNPAGVEYFLWLPTKDGYAPTQNQLRLGAQTIDFFVRNNIQVYTHCKNGHGRAPTLVIAYLVSKGYEVYDAVTEVQLYRPAIHPNTIQIEAVKTFKENLISV